MACATAGSVAQLRQMARAAGGSTENRKQEEETESPETFPLHLASNVL